MNKMDLLLIAGRRPDLIETTLTSINEKVNVDFVNVIVNLDAWAGNEIDHQKAKDVILRFYPNAEINEPKTPGFTKAVKYLWSSVKSDYAFYTEDDWIWNVELDQKDLINTGSGMLRFNNIHNEGREDYGTSPCVITKTFAHEASSVLNLNLDPEKQIRSNPQLFNIVNTHTVKNLTKYGICITDIGRDWRDERDIVKVVKDRKSIWEFN
jgi:hypothetical protein